MKNFFLKAPAIIIACAFAATSCKTNTVEPTPDPIVVVDPTVGCMDVNAKNFKSSAIKDDCQCTYEDAIAAGKLPEAFKQKVVIEEFTGAWCGWCPDGAYKAQLLMDKYPDQAYNIAIHQGDAMAVTSYFSYLDTKFDVQGFPSGMVNRQRSYESSDLVMDRGEWSSNTDRILKNPAKIGMALQTKVVGTEVLVYASVGFTVASQKEYMLNVQVIEENVVGTGTGYDQANYLNNNTSSPFYQKGNPIKGYEHDHVYRTFMTKEVTGEALSACGKEAGAVFTRLYKKDLSGYKIENCKIVAFLVEKGTTDLNSPIVNAQQVKVGQNKAWD